jgi:hypothetical protein
VKYAGFHLGLFFLDLPGWDLLFPVVWRVLVSLVVGTLTVPIVPFKLDGIPTGIGVFYKIIHIIFIGSLLRLKG